MFILGVGRAVPAVRYTQRECWETVREQTVVKELQPRAQSLLRKVLLGDNGIETRYLALDSIGDAFELNPDSLHERYARHAPILAKQAGVNALQEGMISPSEIDALIISSCTGYLCPGLTSYVSQSLGLRPNVLLLDLVGQGCGAAIPNLRAGEALLASGRAGKVLSICVEVCSAAFYIDNDPGVIVSACLFGDGAAAMVLSSNPALKQRRIQWLAAHTVLRPESRDLLRFEQRHGMLRNILAREVPELAGQAVERTLSEQLSLTGFGRDAIREWILHSGGRSILTEVRAALGLEEEDLRWSREVLREFGNLSSPCVYFVLDAALRGAAPGGLWWMSSFGAGFSCHGAFLEVE